MHKTHIIHFPPVHITFANTLVSNKINSYLQELVPQKIRTNGIKKKKWGLFPCVGRIHASVKASNKKKNRGLCFCVRFCVSRLFDPIIPLSCLIARAVNWYLQKDPIISRIKFIRKIKV